MGYIEDLREIVGHRLLLLTGVGVLVINDKKEILLQKNIDKYWGIPGGFMELMETAEETGRREVLEETGIRIGELILQTVISGEDMYRKLANQDEYYGVTIVYSTEEIIGGELQADGSETIEVDYFNLNSLPKNLTKLSKKVIAFYKSNI